MRRSGLGENAKQIVFRVTAISLLLLLSALVGYHILPECLLFQLLLGVLLLVIVIDAIKMNHPENSQFLVFLLVLACIYAASFFLSFRFGENKLVSYWVDKGFNQIIFDLVAIIYAAMGLTYQLKESRKFEEAKFILSLNQSFAQSEDFAIVYTALENEYFKSKEYTSKHPEPHPSTAKDPEPPTRAQISNYLTFFETIFLLRKNGSITIDMIDDLFAYRFFLAVHSDLVQEEKLVCQPINFKNIYHLEKDWIEYRKNNNLHVFREDNCLEQACKRAGMEEEYKEIMKSYKRNGER